MVKLFQDLMFLYNITFLEESGEIEDIQENPLNPAQEIRKNKDHRLRFEDSKMAAANVYPDISMFPDSIFKGRAHKLL